MGVGWGQAECCADVQGHEYCLVLSVSLRPHGGAQSFLQGKKIPHKG